MHSKSVSIIRQNSGLRNLIARFFRLQIVKIADSRYNGGRKNSSAGGISHERTDFGDDGGGHGQPLRGLKQLDPVGPDGEVILDYSLYDAYQAGFRRVVFLIKHEIEDAFKAMVGSRVPAGMEANYAFQQLDKLPDGFSVPEGRVKPWGTGHAVLCCREFLDAPFLVINADDYYGAGAFKLAYEYLRTLRGKRGEYFMVGYALKTR